MYTGTVESEVLRCSGEKTKIKKVPRTLEIRVFVRTASAA